MQILEREESRKREFRKEIIKIKESASLELPSSNNNYRKGLSGSREILMEIAITSVCIVLIPIL